MNSRIFPWGRRQGLVGLGGVLLLFFVAGFYFWPEQSQTIVSRVSSPRPTAVTPLTTAYTNTALYEAAFARTSDRGGVNALALITSHHFLAAPLIASSYAAVASSQVKRIILVSPDHFEQSFKEGELAFVTDAPWDALFGTIDADQIYIDQLIREHSREVRKTRMPFLGEHGIYTEIPFIRYFFPKAKIVPLILKNTYDDTDFVSLGAVLRALAADRDTLVVVSSDFSHHTTHAGRQAADQESITTLRHLDQRKFDGLHNDCRSCVAFLAGYLDASSGDTYFHLLENKDSTDFGGANRDVTSYVTGYFPSKSRDGLATLLFGGDLMFDRSIRTSMKQRGAENPLGGLKETLRSADLVVANLEGPITERASVSDKSEMGTHDNYIFTFEPEVAALLKRSHIDVVNIGNNHIMNFGKDGVVSTKRLLSEAGVGFFGSPIQEGRSLLREIHGMKVALVNYNQFVFQGTEKAFEDIVSAKKQADVIILYAHWGTEYVPVLAPVKELAHRFIEAGADLVIGSHPHIVQEKEVYQGKTIYYSLGNLVFDQYFSEETKRGLLVKVTIHPETHEMSFEDIAVALKTNGQTVLQGEN